MLQRIVPSQPRRIEVGSQRLWLAEPAMIDAFAVLERAARGTMPVLVRGETGAGKELAARAVHQFSDRRRGPLIAINCAAIPEGLAESELFGHERGAFSGALTAKLGLLEAAAGGTVFLDEIGELPLASQARLLRVLDGGTILPLGSVTERAIDVRVVAATNRDLHAAIAVGAFREDLYFRLSGATVTVPPLRERPRELPMLVLELLAASRAVRKRPITINDAAMRALAAHPWPGNVRELKHALEYAIASAGPHAAELDVAHLPPTVLGDRPVVAVPVPPTLEAEPAVFVPLADELRALEGLRMRQALARAGGVQTAAAALLRMPRRTFVSKLKQHKLARADARPRRQPAPPTRAKSAH